jgi:glycosyltransferase involved in cell wall biosynthesis
MRIVHIVPSIAKESSGPSYSILSICKNLVNMGLDIQMLSLDWAPIKSPPKFLLTFKMGWMPRRLGQSPKLYNYLSEQASSNQIDIMHNHGMWQMNSLYPGWVAKKNDLKLVVSPRGTFSEWAMKNGSFMKRFFWVLFQRPSFNNTDCFHATSYKEYEDIRRLGFGQPVAIIPNGIDIPETFEKKNIKLRTLLFLGRIHPVKGLDLLLNAWKEVQAFFPEWQLIVAGSDDDYYGKSGYLNKMSDLSIRLGLERVYFVGELNGVEKFKAYFDAELFILPSHSENFGVSIAEALSHGTPVIASHGTPWEEINVRKAGWWVSNDIEPLSLCLKSALNSSRSDLKSMGDQGRAWMENEFSWKQISQKMLKTYEWLSDKNQPIPEWVKID